MLGSLLGKGLTLIDCTVSDSHSCRKLARPNDEHLKTSPEVFPGDMAAFMSASEQLLWLLFYSYLLFWTFAFFPRTARGAQMLKQKIQLRPCLYSTNIKSSTFFLFSNLSSGLFWFYVQCLDRLSTYMSLSTFPSNHAVYWEMSSVIRLMKLL